MSLAGSGLYCELKDLSRSVVVKMQLMSPTRHCPLCSQESISTYIVMIIMIMLTLASRHTSKFAYCSSADQRFNPALYESCRWLLTQALLRLTICRLKALVLLGGPEHLPTAYTKFTQYALKARMSINKLLVSSDDETLPQSFLQMDAVVK